MRIGLDEMVQSIRKADNTVQLKECHKMIDKQVKRIFPELEFSHMKILYHEINHLHLIIKTKAIEIAAREKGIGETDSFCWGMMGSGAREEQTVKTDQDNCLLFTKERIPFHLGNFSSAGVDNLLNSGYPLCTGNVMATNPRWNILVNSISIDELFEDVRYVFILLDLVPLYGNPALLYDFRKKVRTLLMQRPEILRKMKAAASSLHVPIGPLGRIFTERYGSYAGKFNLKAGAYAPLVIAVKHLSFIHGVDEVNSYRRLDRLRASGTIEEPFSHELYYALDVLLYFRIRQSVSFDFDEEIHDYITLENLSKNHLDSLKKAMRSVKRLQSYVKKRGTQHEAPRE
jgi:signal-transduction protein with cAMP-binding, CBS, and nucleotidyltransferase domain